MSIEDLTLKSCYIGDREVVKLYKGDTLIYEKSSGGGKIYERNGDLIIPAGTVCQIDDWSGETPSTIEYVLPSDIVISGINGEVTLSDGQMVRYYTSVTETKSNYNATITYYYFNEGGRVDMRSYDKTITSSARQTVSRGYYVYDSNLYNAPAGRAVVIPGSLFYIQDTTDGYQPYINSFRLYTNDSRFRLNRLGSIWLRDLGEGDYFKNKYQWSFTGPQDWTPTENDIQVNTSPSGNYTYFKINGSERFPVQKGHSYIMFGIIETTPFIASYTNYYAPYEDGYWSYSSTKTISHYNEPLLVRLSGYKFGEEQEVQASISYYDYPDKLGTAKINEELKYYDVVPSE